MILNEILNRKIPFEIASATHTQFTTATIGNRQIIFSAKGTRGVDNSEIVWAISFHEKVNFSKQFNRKQITHSVFTKTGSGGEFQVFSMVKASLLEFISRYHPSEIYFTAEKTDPDDTRADLYQKLLLRFKIPGYKFIHNSHKDHDIFILKLVK